MTGDVYWGGYTAKGQFLHLASTEPTVYGVSRSPCGLFLDGGSWEDAWFEGLATCGRCLTVRPDMDPR